MKKLEDFKFLAMALFVAVLGMAFTSCSDDDDDKPAMTDYYITCELSGGGLKPQNLEEMQAILNTALAQETLEALEYSQAAYLFEEVVDDLQEEYSDGLSYVNGTLKIKFFLKTKEGKTVKTATLNITKDGCTIEK